MGRLYYGNMPEPIVMPDRVLAHLKIVVATKLRRSESFSLTWHRGRRAPSTVWLHCAIPLRFDLDAEPADGIDRGYLEELAMAASSTNGLVIDLEAPIPAAGRGIRQELGRAA